jgi:ABC-type transporter Mla maintaining outer membrane lipid asymmetry ATPase subunit MlaF
MSGTQPESIIEVKGLRTSFGEAVVHEELDLDRSARARFSASSAARAPASRC